MHRSILIVDDAPLYQEMLKAIVEKLGFIAEICGDGSQAIPLLTANHGAYAAVLLDIYMPEIDGISTLGHISSNWPQLPVIIISGSDDTADAKSAAGLGAHGYIKKPFQPQQILTTLQTLLPTG